MEYRVSKSKSRGIKSEDSKDVEYKDIEDKEVEYKNIDVDSSGQMDEVGSVVLLNPCRQGVESFNRIGRKIVMKYIELRFETRVKPGGFSQVHRMMIVQDMQPNGVAMTFSQLITAGAWYHSGPYNLDNEDRFRVLMDERVFLSDYGTSNAQHCFEKFIEVDIPVTFNKSSNGNIGDIQTNSLYLCVCGQLPAGDGAGYYDHVSRVRFIDS